MYTYIYKYICLYIIYSVYSFKCLEYLHQRRCHKSTLKSPLNHIFLWFSYYKSPKFLRFSVGLMGSARTPCPHTPVSSDHHASPVEPCHNYSTSMSKSYRTYICVYIYIYVCILYNCIYIDRHTCIHI